MFRMITAMLTSTTMTKIAQVEKYLIQEQTTAATKIQAAWRRHAALRNVPVLRQRNILNQAAIKIQRAVSHFNDIISKLR